MKLTHTFASVALAVTAAVVTVEADGVTLQVDQIKQRYPWNGLVDIDYTVTDDDAAMGIDDNLEVLMVDNAVAPAVTYRAITFLQAPLPLTAGAHRITWDANADGVTNRTDSAKFIMKIAHYSAAYMVIDVSGGPTAKTYPVDFLNGAPTLGFNTDEYKGDKIVLRRIHPGSYMAGSPTTEANHVDASEKQHCVALSKPFYIGIFEITKKQYVNVAGGTASGDRNDYRPIENVSYNTIRGSADTTSHQYDWPWTDEVLSTSFIGILRAKCKSRDENGDYTVAVEGFDLPTEFQWEYACRAGTTGCFNTTNAYNNGSASEQEAQLLRLGRYVNNQTDERGGFSSKHTVVGSYEPNGWGLYDMHGNVFEWCLDWYQAGVTDLKQFADPKGPGSGSERLRRGGAWSYAYNNCRSAARSGNGPAFPSDKIGFRLSRTLR